MIEPILTKTPLQRADFLDDAAGNRFWIKRDDLLPFSFGGNKVRIGLAFLEDCLKKGCDAMIIYGDRRSNLCRVLSALCASVGIECLMVSTDAEEDTGGSMPMNERMIRTLGVRILSCAKDRIADTVDEAFRTLEEEGKKAYYIYGNRLGEGNEHTAVSAYVKACTELLEQEALLNAPIQYVYTACGTGSTLSGLAAGLCEGGSEAQVTGISISSRSDERAKMCVEKAVRSWYESQGRGVPERLWDHLRLETRYNCGGYGVPDRRVQELIDHVFRVSSIPLDPTYTGKAMRGMLDDLERRGVRDSNVLFLHTGGTPLYFDTLARDSE